VNKNAPARARIAAALTAVAALAASIAMTGPAHAAATSGVRGPDVQAADVRPVCGPAKPGHARCFALLRTGVHGGFGVRGPAAHAAGETGAATTLPAGYGPADLRSAYKLPATGGTGQTVALIDAGDDPDAAADLAVYRATYGLPACTTASGCFTKVNEEGQAAPLPGNLGWGPEISLDLDMVSAACPSCHILLVEANSTSDADLGAAANTAAKLGATEISNSYGSEEQRSMLRYKADYSHPGVAVLASAGDGGYSLVPNFPAVLQTVIAVGGTRLTRAPGTTRGWREKSWGGADTRGATASGCSAWIAKPAWQHDADCPGRMVADVASDADPDTGLAIYDSYDGYGWTIVGGTSAASPFLAGVIALAGNPGAFPNASYLYQHASSLYDITQGTSVIWPNGDRCGGGYLCHAKPGYDGPTGNGTPDGTGAF
jgi:subtilase family serine protease